jgi:phytoene synthase
MIANMNSQAWQHLHSLAFQGLQSAPKRTTQAQIADTALLEAAYVYCETLTAHHSKSFYAASALLPANKRHAIRALYAFCRVSDDIVDHPDANVAENLALWRERVLSGDPLDHDLVALAWTDARTTYHVPVHYITQLLDGVASDLHVTRYATFHDLATYCYGVASTVGLMSMHITGFSGPEAIPYAVKLGVALQLTNILRDVGEDWQRGRLYLPQDELAAFGLTEADVAAGQVTDRWRDFMRFQIERTRQLYEEAIPGIAMLHRDGQHAIAAATAIYGAILDDIERNDYDVFNRRAYVGKARKVGHLITTWLSIHSRILRGALRRATRAPRFSLLQARFGSRQDSPDG